MQIRVLRSESMRSVVATVVVAFALTGCPPDEPLGTDCKVAANCADNEICVNGSCVPDVIGPIPVEGEGVTGDPKGEGEGEGVVVGVGGEGEGEGDITAEGEGEGAEGEGAEGEGAEGEGAEGEGAEGEGVAPPPVCDVGECGFQQDCTADHVCTNQAGSVICDSVPSTTIDFFADQTSTIDNAVGDRFTFQGKDRFYVRRVTNMRPGMKVDVQVTSSIDVEVYLLDDSNLQCAVAADIDSFVTNEEFLLNVPANDINMVVTSFDEIPATATVGIRTRGILCDGSNAANSGNALGDETDTQATYDQCFRALFEEGATSNTCASANPCARDANNNTVGKFCTLQSNVHTANTLIVRQNDVPDGPCCGTSAGCDPDGANCPVNCVH